MKPCCTTEPIHPIIHYFVLVHIMAHPGIARKIGLSILATRPNVTRSSQRRKELTNEKRIKPILGTNKNITE